MPTPTHLPEPFDEAEWRAETDAIMQPPPRALVTAGNPDSPVNRARRAMLTKRVYQIRAWQGDLQDQLSEAVSALYASGGAIGEYAEYADSLAPLASNDRDHRLAVLRLQMTIAVLIVAGVSVVVGFGALVAILAHLLA